MYVPKSVVCLRAYSWDLLRGDLAAGLVVGLVALPLAMAFAIASGLPPARGLATAVAAGFLISALGGSRVQIGGPTGAFVVIVYGIVQKFGYEGLAWATLMGGLILVLMGLSRLGTAIKFIPYPVTTGFTSGIAVVILSGQVRDFLGLSMDAPPPDFLEKWRAYARALPTLNPWALGLSLGTVLVIALWPQGWRKVPASVAALAFFSWAAARFSLPVETIQSRFGGVPRGLQAPHLPPLSWDQARLLLPSALTIAILAAIESLLSAVVADGMIGGRHKSNLELVAQGLANIASPLFGGLPATGAIARTATNVKNGGRTPVAGMVHALVLFLVLLWAGPLASRIPLACMAGILVVVSYHMSEWRSFRSLLSAPASDVLVLLATFLLTVLVDLTVAVEVGIVLAAFLFMRNMAESSEVRALVRQTNDEGSDRLRGVSLPAGVEVFTIQGSFFFGVAAKLLEALRIVEKAPRVLILDMEGVLHLDATGMHVLDQVHKDSHAAGTRLILAGIHAQPMVALQKANRYRRYGEENFAGDLGTAIRLGARPPSAGARAR